HRLHRRAQHHAVARGAEPRVAAGADHRAGHRAEHRVRRRRQPARARRTRRARVHRLCVRLHPRIRLRERAARDGSAGARALLVAAGTLASLEAQPPQQQGPRTIDVDKVKDNLWVLKGGGGNTAVFVTADGVTVVDAKNPGWGQPILDKIKELTPKPVTRLINTHTHGDHVSGNVEFPASVEIVTQENTKTNMEKMDIFKQNSGKGLPKRTFKDKMTIGKGADQIDLY